MTFEVSTILTVVVLFQAITTSLLVLWLRHHAECIGNNREYICREMLKDIPLPIDFDTILKPTMEVKMGPEQGWQVVDTWKNLTVREAMVCHCTHNEVGFRYKGFPATEVTLRLEPDDPGGNTYAGCGHLVPSGEEFLVCRQCFESKFPKDDA